MGAQPYGPGPDAVVTKDEPWGPEDPLTWYGRRVRRQSLMAMFSIALLVLFYGGGMYGLFTTAVYEGGDDFGGGVLLLIAIAFIMSFVVGGLIARLAVTAGRYGKLPGSPTGTLTGRILLWLAALLWFLLVIAFVASATITTEPADSDEPFPIGILTVFPVYLGLGTLLFTSGASMLSWSERNRIESATVLGLGLAAFAVFLILPMTISNWEFGETSAESIIFWIRFGMLFPAILPWLIIVGLYYSHGRSVELLVVPEGNGSAPAPIHGANGAGGTAASACSRCGGALSVHPRTQEVFCTACGDGLGAGRDIIVDDRPAYEFVEQLAPAASPRPPASGSTGGGGGPAACTVCGGKLSVLSLTQQVYCTSCGAGLPSPQVAPAPPPVPAPTRDPAHTHARPPPTTSPAPSSPPARPGTCTQCGAALSVHPRTGEVFCPACGAGLSPEP